MNELKTRIVGTTAQIKHLRLAAQKVKGNKRHLLKMQARDLGTTQARAEHLALAYLRGRMVWQVESPNTRTPVDVGQVVSLALEHWKPLPKNPDGTWKAHFDKAHADKESFRAMIEADLKRWNDIARDNLTGVNTGRYRLLMEKLDGLIAEGKDESDKGEQLREMMDEVWKMMSPRNQQALQAEPMKAVA